MPPRLDWRVILRKRYLVVEAAARPAPDRKGTRTGAPMIRQGDFPMKALVLPLLVFGVAVATHALARESRKAVQPVPHVAVAAGSAWQTAQHAGRSVLVAQLDPARGTRSGK